MSEKSVKIQRTEALLIELIMEALGTLEDSRLHGVTVTAVDLSRGKSDADVYIDGTDLDDAEQKTLIVQLSKAAGAVSRYCLASEGWYKMPKLHFKIDTTMEHANRIEALFKAIKSND